MKTFGISETTFQHIAIPLNDRERHALDALKKNGIQKGHWVAQAIRERLEREKLLPAQEVEK